ncbi:ESPR-type extended signal peptide-containing protein [Escherichia coli]
MNKIYNIVWNESSGMWVVTSELTRKGGQRHRKIKRTMLAGLIAGLMLPTVPALAQVFNDEILDYSSSMSLSAGDSAFNTTIDGGEQYVSSGGSAISTTINDGAQIIFNGGTASTTTINGGYQDISSGGSVTNTLISGGDQVYISDGGSATNTVIDGGTQYISSGRQCYRNHY